MQSEEFNKKIIEAAEQHHPAYDEQAWQKMEKMLDKHLPGEEKDRRRMIFFVLFFLFLGAALFIAIDKPWQNKDDGGNSEVNLPRGTEQPSNNSGSSNAVHPENQAGAQTTDESISISQDKNNTPSVNFQPANRNKLLIPDPKFRDKKVDISGDLPLPGDNIVSNEKVKTGIPQLGNEKQSTINDIKKDVITDVITKNDPASQQNADVKKSETPDNNDAKATPNPATVQKNKAGVNKFLDGFVFSLSAGPDVSRAGESKFGKTTMSFGAGVGYTWKKFTLRTGIYSARKIYSADESEYKLNYPLPQNIVFEGADAKCRVFEIPFSLSYNFAEKKNSGWFASAGLSTYLMKEEEYTYWYSNTSNGSYYPKYFEFKNKNRHYFTVINLSGGYTRKLNNTVSVTAEPYLRIPFQGVGAGKVQLNSGGVLFSVGIQPFNSKNKK
jgi:hypothetical protein